MDDGGLFDPSLLDLFDYGGKDNWWMWELVVEFSNCCDWFVRGIVGFWGKGGDDGRES